MTEEPAQLRLPEGAAREDLELLYASALRVVVDSVTRRSGFPPFALVLREDGTLSGVRAGVDPGGVVPGTADVLRRLHDGLRRRVADGGVRACVVATDLSIRHPTGGPPDAARLAFEMAAGHPVCLVVPYVPDAGENGEPHLAPAFAVTAEPVVFGTGTASP